MQCNANVGSGARTSDDGARSSDDGERSSQEPQPEVIIIDDEPWELPLDEHNDDGDSDGFVMTIEEKQRTERITNELREHEEKRKADREAANEKEAAKAELEKERQTEGGPCGWRNRRKCGRGWRRR